MRKQITPPGLGQLDFFAVFDAKEVVRTVEAAPPPPEHPAGSYLIHSEGERGYWSNAKGWVKDVASATPYAPLDVCAAQVTQWRRDGQPIMSAKGNWYWVARPGGLCGIQGADFEGPFMTAEAATLSANETHGPDRPLMATRDAEYVLASAVFDLEVEV